MYLCDACASVLVIKKLITPPGKHPNYHKGQCENCNENTSISFVPEANKKMFKEKMDINN